MFNVRPDKFWPWFRVPTLTDDSLGIRPPTADPVQDFRSYNEGFGASAFAGGTAAVPSNEPSLEDAASLLFPRMNEPPSLWPGSHNGDGEFDAWRNTPVPGFNIKPPQEYLPGFRLAPDNLTRNVPPTGVGPMFFNFGNGDMASPTDNIRSNEAHSSVENQNSSDFLNRLGSNQSTIPPFDGGSLPPDVSSLLFPRLGEQSPAWLGLQGQGATPYVPSDVTAPGFDAAAQEKTSFAHGSRLDDALATAPDFVSGPYPTENDIYAASLPTDSSETSGNRIQQALRQVEGIYAGLGRYSNGVPDHQISYPASTTFFNGAAGAASPAVGETFDPRFIIPTQVQPPRTHNGGPPLTPSSPSSLPTQPSRPGPTPSPGLASPRDTSSETAGAAAAATVSKNEKQETPSIDTAAEAKLEAWQVVARGREEPTPHDQHLKEDGTRTLAGVRLNPKLGMPQAGRYYFPTRKHLLDGYRGELILANRIAALLPNEVVINYGMPAGFHGPDVISLSPTGVISIWDSKWRGGQRSIAPRDRAHPSINSQSPLKWTTAEYINAAVESGRLQPDVAKIARANLWAGNFDIYTIGTGNAHGGVVQSVRNFAPDEPRRR